MISFFTRLLAVGALTLLLVNAAWAQELILKNLVLDNVAGDIQLRFGVALQDLDKVEDLLQEGATITMGGESSLIRKRKLFWDKTLKHAEMTFELKKDPLSETYILTDTRTQRVMKNQDLPTLIKANWGTLSMSLGSWDSLPRGVKYAMNLKVVLKRAHVPGWLKTALFFWSWDVVDQKQYRMDFVY
jgi:hypothetical protein